MVGGGDTTMVYTINYTFNNWRSCSRELHVDITIR